MAEAGMAGDAQHRLAGNLAVTLPAVEIDRPTLMEVFPAELLFRMPGIFLPPN
jgi:hypothetical protein